MSSQGNQLTAENLKKYLETKNVISSNHSELLDNSIVVSNTSGPKYKSYSKEDRQLSAKDSEVLDHSSIKVLLDGNPVTSPEVATNNEQDDTSTH